MEMIAGSVWQRRWTEVMEVTEAAEVTVVETVCPLLLLQRCPLLLLLLLLCVSVEADGRTWLAQANEVDAEALSTAAAVAAAAVCVGGGRVTEAD